MNKLLWVLLLCLILAIPVDAHNKTIAGYRPGQGDIIYQGDTYDLTGVMDWTMQVGWWKNYYASEKPDVIVNLESFPTRVYIDPVKFPLGTWHKWSGTKEEHGNTLAFYVEPPNSTYHDLRLGKNITYISPNTTFVPSHTNNASVINATSGPASITELGTKNESITNATPVSTVITPNYITPEPTPDVPVLTLNPLWMVLGFIAVAVLLGYWFLVNRV
jgi:hypothetical protein